MSDVNRDGWVDLVYAVNDSEMVAFENQKNQPFHILLKGSSGNPTAVVPKLLYVWKECLRSW